MSFTVYYNTFYLRLQDFAINNLKVQTNDLKLHKNYYALRLKRFKRLTFLFCWRILLISSLMSDPDMGISLGRSTLRPFFTQNKLLQHH